MILTKAQLEQCELCYALRHSWDVYSARPGKAEFGDALELRCERCDTARTDTLGVHGEPIASPSYVKSDIYAQFLEDVTCTRQEMKLKIMRRAAKR